MALQSDEYGTVLVLTEQERAILTREINGCGGFQSLLRAIRSRLEDNRLGLTPELSRRIVRYASRYGNGGFQSRLRRIVEAAKRA